MKIVIVLQSEPFYIVETLSRIAKKRHKDIAGIITLPYMAGNKSIIHAIFYYYNFFGLRSFAIILARLIKNKIFSAVNRFRRTDKFYSVKNIADYFSIPLYSLRDINNEFSIRILKSLDPDLIVSLSATQKFGKELLGIPELGCINLHSAPLPRYRGIFPTFWAMLNDEAATAATVHFLDEGIDTGKIILQREIPISKEDTLDSLLKKVKITGGDLMLEALDQIESNTVSFIDKSNEKSSYNSLPGFADAAQFLKKGKKFF